MIDSKEYDKLAGLTDIYKMDSRMVAYALGLCSEAGEVAGKIKKSLRGDHSVELIREEILLELGDILWYASRMAEYLDSSTAEVMELNIGKLAERKKRGTIKGSGDHR
jgi:NTP pyrophosphatase (non-canonical NTP hydrolase)